MNKSKQNQHATDLTEADIAHWERWLGECDIKIKSGSEKFAALLAAAREGLAGRWMPIETAPKDVRIFVWDGAAVHLAKWSNRWEDWIPLDSNFKIEPTHWMPLPPPPQARRDWQKYAGLSHLTTEEIERLFPTTDAAMQEREDDGLCVDCGMPESSHSTAYGEHPFTPSPSVVSEGETAGAAARRLAKEELAMLRRVSQRVVSEGEPTPRTKCEPSGTGLVNGLQPQPSVGELARDLEAEAEWVDGQRDFVGSQSRTVGIMRKAATALKELEEAWLTAEGKLSEKDHALKQQAGEIERLSELRGTENVLAEGHIGRLHAELNEAQATIKQQAKTKQAFFEAWQVEKRNGQEAEAQLSEAQAEIERITALFDKWYTKAAEAQALVKRYREALEWYAVLDNYYPTATRDSLVHTDQGNRARQALTDGEKE